MSKTKTDYGRVDKFLHWVMALNIFATLIFSKGMSQLPPEQKVIEYGDHGLSVTTIALFLLFRIVWRLSTGFAALPETMTAMQKTLAKLVHYGLYLALVCQLFIGLLLSSTTRQDFVASGYGINYSNFNLISDDNHEALLALHIGMYWLIVALLAAHMLAALKHHFVDKDDVLRRMLPGAGN